MCLVDSLFLILNFDCLNCMNTNLSSGVGVTELRDCMDTSGDGGIVTVTGDEFPSTPCLGPGEGCLSSLCWGVGEGGGWWWRLD